MPLQISSNFKHIFKHLIIIDLYIQLLYFTFQKNEVKKKEYKTLKKLGKYRKINFLKTLQENSENAL